MTARDPGRCRCGHDAGSHDRTKGHCRAAGGRGTIRIHGICRCPKFRPRWPQLRGAT